MKRIVIIGAGIIGAALADALARRCRVTVVDAAAPGQGTTASSLAWVNANKTLDTTYFTFRVAAMREWTRLFEEFGRPPWYAPSGNLMWADDKTAAELVTRTERLSARHYPARLLHPSDVPGVEPALRPPANAIVAHFPHEAFVHGSQATQALLDRARDTGARLISGNRVEALTSDHGRVTGVQLASGDSITADAVVCAAGWQAPRILASAGATIPLLHADAPGSAAPCLVATTTPADALRGLVHAPGIYARPAWNGGLLLEASDLDTATDMKTPDAVLQARAGELLVRFREIAPALAPEVRVATARRCIRPMPSDGFPLVGWSQPGLYTAVTHSGVTLAPYLARLIAPEIADETPIDELSPYRPNRTPLGPSPTR